MSSLKLYFGNLQVGGSDQTPGLVQVHGGGRGENTTKEMYEFQGIRIDNHTGQWQSCNSLSCEDVFSKPVLDMVTSVSIIANFIKNREAGRYIREDVAAVLEEGTLRVTSKTLESARDMYYEILAGKIRPEESWGNPQAGKSRKELVEENRGLQDLCNRAVEKLERIDKIVTWRDSLWPLVWKSTIRHAIAKK